MISAIPKGTIEIRGKKYEKQRVYFKGENGKESKVTALGCFFRGMQYSPNRLDEFNSGTYAMGELARELMRGVKESRATAGSTMGAQVEYAKKLHESGLLDGNDVAFKMLEAGRVTNYYAAFILWNKVPDDKKNALVALSYLPKALVHNHIRDNFVQFVENFQPSLSIFTMPNIREIADTLVEQLKEGRANELGGKQIAKLTALMCSLGALNDAMGIDTALLGKIIAAGEKEGIQGKVGIIKALAEAYQSEGANEAAARYFTSSETGALLPKEMKPEELLELARGFMAFENGKGAQEVMLSAINSNLERLRHLSSDISQEWKLEMCSLLSDENVAKKTHGLEDGQRAGLIAASKTAGSIVPMKGVKWIEI
ncbi:MAG: hypothetical protein WC861_00250 [Candidatus Micrarchaeia archaeon]|jgi:hypothetical protein